MKIGVAKEIKPDEYRVALTPAGARELVQHGHDVTIETGSGVGSAFPDDAYEAAGADVLYAPGLKSVDEIRTVCDAVSKPVNVLARPQLTFDDITGAGAQRISVGGALTWVAVAGLISAAEAIRDRGDFSVLASGADVDEYL